MYDWPKCHFFGIFDGHGGHSCSDFMRDNLHQYIIQHNAFPCNVEEAIRAGCQQAENCFLEIVKENYFTNESKSLNESGTCAVATLIVDAVIYVINVGDSRCLISNDHGKNFAQTTTDHKPDHPVELERIKLNGGSIYRNKSKSSTQDQTSLPI